jgi:ATP-binding cassette subfamily F protein 3
LVDYDYYLEKKQEEAEIAALLEEKEETVTVSTGKQNFQQSKEQQKIIRNLQRKIEKIEEDLATLDEEITASQTQMTEPEILNNHVKLNELNQFVETAQQRQEQLMEEWETLSLELEELN